MSLETNIKAAIRDVPDFPKPGIMFKDITPIFENQALCNEIVDGFIASLSVKPDAIVGIESRGFLFGLLISEQNQCSICFSS
jgi:adenine phosphoribosyltransferase